MKATTPSRKVAADVLGKAPKSSRPYVNAIITPVTTIAPINAPRRAFQSARRKSLGDVVIGRALIFRLFMSVHTQLRHHARAFRTSRAWACWAFSRFLNKCDVRSGNAS